MTRKFNGSLRRRPRYCDKEVKGPVGETTLADVPEPSRTELKREIRKARVAFAVYRVFYTEAWL